jgi:hypothetical protein
VRELLWDDCAGARGLEGECGETTGLQILIWTRIRNSDSDAARLRSVQDDNNDNPNNPVISNKKERRKRTRKNARPRSCSVVSLSSMTPISQRPFFTFNYRKRNLVSFHGGMFA